MKKPTKVQLAYGSAASGISAPVRMPDAVLHVLPARGVDPEHVTDYVIA
jgi:hypothetical protein